MTAMIDHVLVPLDGTTIAELAIDHAAAIARRFHAPLTLIRAYDGARLLAFASASVAHGNGPDGMFHPETVRLTAEAIQRQQQEARAYLDEWARVLRATGLTVEILVQDGPAKAVILEAAAKASSAIVVMGAPKRGWLRRLLCGSTVDALLGRADVPVMVIHGREHPTPPMRTPRWYVLHALSRTASSGRQATLLPVPNAGLQAAERHTR
jgi:nucleotide-binding universal stress UspA family protein